jgi:hypothetical protein
MFGFGIALAGVGATTWSIVTGQPAQTFAIADMCMFVAVFGALMVAFA